MKLSDLKLQDGDEVRRDGFGNKEFRFVIRDDVLDVRNTTIGSYVGGSTKDYRPKTGLNLTDLAADDWVVYRKGAYLQEGDDVLDGGVRKVVKGCHLYTEQSEVIAAAALYKLV